MSYLVVNFTGSAQRPEKVAVPFEEIKGMKPVDGDQIRILFKDDVTERNDYGVYVKGDLEDLCKTFAEAQRNGDNVDASEVTQSTPFKAGAKVGELFIFS